MSAIIESFKAFNANGFASLAYLFGSNWWFFLIAVGAIGSMVMMLLDETDRTIHKEEQVL